MESYADLCLHIDGERIGRGGRRVFPVVNPATGTLLGELPLLLHGMRGG